MLTTNEIIDSCPKFPCRLTKFQANILKRDFILNENEIQKQPDQKTLLYKYYYTYNTKQYMLLEEFLFRDNETVIDINRAIGRNYYLCIVD